MTTYAASCSAGSGCGVSSFSGTDTDSCSGTDICSAGSGCGAPSSCSLPWGGILSHGSSVTAYSASSVPFGNVCSSISQTRSCNNGVLSGSSSYDSANCLVDGASSCSLPLSLGGGSLSHGSSVTAYSSPNVPFGDVCSDIDQTRSCSNGVLSGSYTNENCFVGAALAGCSLGGETISHGSGFSFFSDPSPSFPTQCSDVDQYRVCDDGVLSGSNSYDSSSCTDPVGPNVDCVGSWVDDGAPYCDTGISIQEQEYVITTPLSGSGVACSHNDGEVRSIGGGNACTSITCEATGSSGLTEFDVGDSTMLYNSLSGPGCNSKSRTCQSDGTWGGPFSSWVYTTCDEPVIETCTFLRPYGWWEGSNHCLEYFKSGGPADEMILNEGQSYSGSANYCVSGTCHGDFTVTCNPGGSLTFSGESCTAGHIP
jgi:hypothetical protein